MREIIYRSGRKEDCAQIALGICLASGGIMDFLAQALPQEALPPEKWLEKELMSDQPGNSFREAVIAECGAEIAGVVYCYPANFFGLSDAFKKALGVENTALIEDFFDSRVEGSLFLDSLYVWPKWRRKGIGEVLIGEVMKLAKSQGLAKVSLMVMVDNVAALSVYQRAGFRVEKKVRLEKHPLIPHEGGALLLSLEVA